MFGASKDSKIQTFSGTPLPATLETTEFEPSPMGRSMIKSVTPIVSKGSAEPTVTAQVGTRSKQTVAPTFTNASSLNSDNTCSVRSNGRYHRVRVNASGTWRYALGVDVDAVKAGKR